MNTTKNNVIAGALHDFVHYLANHPDPMTIGQGVDTRRVDSALFAFMSARGLAYADANKNWVDGDLDLSGIPLPELMAEIGRRIER